QPYRDVRERIARRGAAQAISLAPRAAEEPPLAGRDVVGVEELPRRQDELPHPRGRALPFRAIEDALRGTVDQERSLVVVHHDVLPAALLGMEPESAAGQKPETPRRALPRSAEGIASRDEDARA